MEPEIGRLMFANWPPLGLFQAQTLGGVYSDELLSPYGSSFQFLSAAGGDAPNAQTGDQSGFSVTAA
jgi:hypothetical protein